MLHSLDQAYIVTLMVLLPASVYSSVTILEPSELIVNVGDNATFKCFPSNPQSLPVLSTTDPVTGQTKVLIGDDRVISEHVQAQPAFQRFIWLNASQEDDRRKFFCTFANMVSETSTLFIASDLTIEFEEMGPFTVMSEETLEVSITIMGFPPPNVTWSLNGVTIGNNTRQIVSSTGVTTSPVKPDDAGTYTVIAENGFSSATVTFELIVIFAPIFIMDNRLSVREGEMTSINCSAIAFPADISYTLTNNGIPITLAADNSYTIDPTRMQDAGIYTCTATNDIGTSVLNITLEVKSLPGQVIDIMVDDNESNITISWGAAEENGAEIIGYNIIIKYREMGKEFNSDGPTTTITVTNEELRDLFSKGGEKMVTIIITAVNGIGEGEAVTEQETINVEYVPGQVSNIMVDDNDNNITISWGAAEENGAKIIGYSIVIKYKEIGKEFSSDGPTTSITVTNEELRDLFSKGGEKMITIIITAVNGIGEGEAVTEQETINVEYVPGQVSNIMVGDNHDNLTISWGAAEENGAEIIGYNIIIKYKEIGKGFSSDGPTTTITVTNEAV